MARPADPAAHFGNQPVKPVDLLVELLLERPASGRLAGSHRERLLPQARLQGIEKPAHPGD